MPRLDSFKDWPPVPPELLLTLKQWTNQPEHTTMWTPGGDMTGDQALGSLAFISGMGYVIQKLEVVHRKQLDAMRSSAQPSHVRE
jgi:hypothetical protein